MRFQVIAFQHHFESVIYIVMYWHLGLVKYKLRSNQAERKSQIMAVELSHGIR